MRLALLLLAFSCALAWTAASLRAQDAAPADIVAAKRARPAAGLKTAALKAGPLSDIPELPGGPSLFRSLQPPAKEAERRAGESFALLGVVARGDERIALLRDEVDQRVWRLRLRDKVAAWTVERIDERCVVLKRGHRRIARQERCM